MSKNRNESFRLQPKHLIRALFVVSIVAVGVLVAGVVSTLNPKHNKEAARENTVQTPKDEGVEVWRPNGTVEPKKIMLGDNPPAQENEADGNDSAASRNPAIPPQARNDSRRRSQTAGAENQDTPNTPGNSRVERNAQTENKPEQPESASRPPARQEQQTAQQTQQPSQPAAEPKPEPKPESVPRPAPKPVQPKQQNKEVIDNLF